MSKSITIIIKHSYGRTIYYPQCDAGITFAKIAGNKTLTQENLRDIEALGYTICQELPEGQDFPLAGALK